MYRRSGTSLSQLAKSSARLTRPVAPPKETKFIYRRLGWCRLLIREWLEDAVLESSQARRAVLGTLDERPAFAGSVKYHGPPVASIALRVRSRFSALWEEASAASTRSYNGRGMA
jgi:hypothetical protein